MKFYMLPCGLFTCFIWIS